VARKPEVCLGFSIKEAPKQAFSLSRVIMRNSLFIVSVRAPFVKRLLFEEIEKESSSKRHFVRRLRYYISANTGFFHLHVLVSLLESAPSQKDVSDFILAKLQRLHTRYPNRREMRKYFDDTHPDGGEDLVGLDVLQTMFLLTLVHQLQMRLEMCWTEGTKRQRGSPWR